MKNPVNYIKQHGIRHAVKTIWNYKIPNMQVKIIARFTAHLTLEDKIVIESHNDFDCNGGAFYDYLIEHGYNKRIKIVWRLYHTFDGRLPENVYAVPLYGPSWRKAWHICTAKWLTADSSVADRVRKDQVSLYMTHGIFGLKNFKGSARVPMSVSDVLSPSEAMDSVFVDMREIVNPETRLVHLGYPVLDRLHDQRHSESYEADVDARPMILWMPTFRKGITEGRCDATGSYPYGVALIENPSALNELAGFLRTEGVRMVIKLHPKEDLSILARASMERVADVITFITGDMMGGLPFDTYDLMLDSLALITDYSGAVFEYIALDKPICFVMSDIKQYKIGLVPDSDKYMPGAKVETFCELKNFVHSVCNGGDEYARQRREFERWFYRWNDSNSCKRIAAYLGMS